MHDYDLISDDRIFEERVDIQMGIYCAPYLADLRQHSHEATPENRENQLNHLNSDIFMTPFK